MYARTDNTNRKSEHELVRLRDFGLQSLHIDLESGSDEVLPLMRKETTIEDFLKLDENLK